MPRYCDTRSAYGCGHHQEHVLAARKGWATRRRNGQSPSERARAIRAESALSKALGEEVTQLHTHAAHPDEIRYKAGDQWYRMSRQEFADLEKWATGINRENTRLERAARRDAPAAEKLRELAEAEEELAKMMLLEEWEGAQYREVRAHLRKHPLIGSKQTRFSTRYDKRGRNRQVPVDWGEIVSAVPPELRRMSGGMRHQFNTRLDTFGELLHSMGIINEGQAETWRSDDTIAWFERMTEYEANVGGRSGIAKQRKYITRLKREVADVRRVARGLAPRARKPAARKRKAA